MNVRPLLRDAVSIPSTNPLLPGGRPGDGEGELASFVLETLRSAGIDAELQDVLPGRPNVLACLEGNGPYRRETLLLCGHMDTYPPSHEDQARGPVETPTTIVGRGTADAKGSLVAMMVALFRSAQSNCRRTTYLCATVDEEFGLAGARRLAQSGLRPDLAITGEPTSLVPVVAQKGIVRARFAISGPSSHAAYPGDCDIFKAARLVLEAIERLHADYSRAPVWSSLSPPSITSTQIEANGSMNATPTSIHISFDARYLPGMPLDGFFASIGASVLAIGDLHGCHVELEPPNFTSPPNACPPELPLVRALRKSVSLVTGSDRYEEFSYGSEAGILSTSAKASLVFGPGDATRAHRPDEQVDWHDVEGAAKIFEELICSTT
jgi:acetylornithine deacetylase